jgi:hypothetical protein
MKEILEQQASLSSKFNDLEITAVDHKDDIEEI